MAENTPLTEELEDTAAELVREGIYGDDRQTMTDCDRALAALRTILDSHRKLELALFRGARIALDCEEVKCDCANCPDDFPFLSSEGCSARRWVQRRIEETTAGGNF